MNHTWELHTMCERPYCPICVGGLGSCTVCGGAECELPSECPGAPMTDEQKEQVCAGQLDYRNGQWQARDPKPTFEWII